MVHLPAVNTPQFDHAHNHLPRKPQPVPPIYQPEVPARAIYWAAHHRDREVYVGFPTVKAILGNKLIPGLLDRYLAKKAYEGEMRAEFDDPNRPDNLWAPVPGDHGAHGAFDDVSRAHSLELWMAEHKRGLALAGVGIAGIASAALLVNRTRV